MAGYRCKFAIAIAVTALVLATIATVTATVATIAFVLTLPSPSLQCHRGH
jgi:hypothetical protein